MLREVSPPRAGDFAFPTWRELAMIGAKLLETAGINAPRKKGNVSPSSRKRLIQKDKSCWKQGYTV